MPLGLGKWMVQHCKMQLLSGLKKLVKAYFKPDSDCVKELDEKLVFYLLLSLVFLPRAWKQVSEAGSVDLSRFSS